MHIRTLISAALCGGLFFSAAIRAQEISPAPAAKPRPKVALVLSGGGARGFAHIGVLRVLQELRVPVDFVVGTSMGSVVGGAYAAGSPVDQLEQLVRRTDWNAVIADRPPRDELAYRRREEDLLLPSRIEFGAFRDGLTLPPAAAGNEALELALTRALPAGTRDKPVSKLQLPFRSVASDLVTGELVELNETPLFLAMRASLAVPGVFAPVRVDGHLVVDGGLVRNLPVDVARAMGADIVIAVNVGTPLASEKSLGSAVGVAQQMLQILTEQNVQRSLKELKPGDILIAPDLAGVGFLDFERHDKAMQAGVTAARAASEQLVKLALPEAQYTAYEQHRVATPVIIDQARPLVAVKVEPGGRINPKELEVQSGLKPGQTITLDQAQAAGALLFGRGDLSRVETEVRELPEGREVTIKPTEAEWARSRLRVGLELNSDFADNNNFQLKAMHVATSLNSWGGELRTQLKVGGDRSIGTQFWQPLGPGSAWYVAPSLEYGGSSGDIFNTAGARQARFSVKYGLGMVEFGRQLGNWGDVRIGVARMSQQAHMTVPEDLKKVDSTITAQRFAFVADTLDTVAFPTRGTLTTLEWERYVGVDKEGVRPQNQRLQGLQAFHAGRWAGHIYGEWSRSRSQAGSESLGGFLRLSGSTPNSIIGDRVLLGRIVMARAIGAMPAALGGDVRLGFSLEAGGSYGPENPLHWGSLHQAAAGFVSVDTRFGPLYFGAGTTKAGNSSLYLFLGPIW